MKKLVVLISVMAMSVGSFAASSSQVESQGLEDILKLIGSLIEHRQDRNEEEEKKGRLVTEKYSVPVDRNRVLEGESVVSIRAALLRRGVNLDRKAIKSVTVNAKSQHGRGVVSLQTGRFDTRKQTIAGDRRSFEQRGPRTFHKISLRPQLSVQEQLGRGGVNGAVRLNIRGNVKVRSVEVEVVRRKRRR